MTPIDLLELTTSGQLSIDQAYELAEKAIDFAHQGGRDWRETLGFTDLEARAYAHAASLAQLTHVRAKGWPETCCRCSLPINVTSDHWLFISRTDGRPAVRHLICPNGYDGPDACQD